jgi:hypothetical protein
MLIYPPGHASTHELLSNKNPSLHVTQKLLTPLHVLQLLVQSAQLVPRSTVTSAGQAGMHLDKYSFIPSIHDVQISTKSLQFLQFVLQSKQFKPD